MGIIRFQIGAAKRYDIYLDALADLLKHITDYAERVSQDSADTAAAMRDFSAILKGDKSLFETDQFALKNMTTMTEKELARKIAELDQYRNNSVKYKDAIDAAIKKIQEWQEKVCIVA